MKKMNNKGFSLVELIVVIAIMVVLMGVLAPTFSKFIERGKKSTDCTNIDSIAEALKTYASDPQVEDDDQIADGDTLILNASKKAEQGATGSGNVFKALKDNGIGGDDGDDIKLKSKKWYDPTTNSTGDIVLTIKIADNGAVTITSSGEKTGYNIMDGKYK